MVGEVFSLKSFWTNRSTREDLPTAASPMGSRAMTEQGFQSRWSIGDLKWSV